MVFISISIEEGPMVQMYIINEYENSIERAFVLSFIKNIKVRERRLCGCLTQEAM